ncbi:MAG: sigma-70 family RNA polymerase sigma factor [Firmicutes bacterium]|nr:sigma-70 family RNA polymerase sigma factor [Bacillota bacterium]
MKNNSKVSIMGINTNQLPTLKAKEMAELMEKVKDGCRESRQQLIYCNFKLVLSVCKRFSSRREQIDDIFQVGVMGLCKAVDNFDPKFNVKFSTYAVPMIIGEIRRYLRDTSIVRVSRGLRDIAYQALLIKEQNKDLDSEVTNEQIAQILGIDLSQVAAALEAVSEPISLYAPAYGDDDKLSLADTISSATDTEDEKLRQLCLKEAIKVLGEREKEIIDLRYFQGKTQIEVSKEVGISQAQVSRLEKNALKILEQYI